MQDYVSIIDKRTLMKTTWRFIILPHVLTAPEKYRWKKLDISELIMKTSLQLMNIQARNSASVKNVT